VKIQTGADFILDSDALWLNGKHTIFANVDEGMDVVDIIASSEVGITGIPTKNIYIKDIQLLY
jgi:cyclophilin family peptidyl-prolyl cis-trans isomerase